MLDYFYARQKGRKELNCKSYYLQNLTTQNLMIWKDKIHVSHTDLKQ